MRNAHEKGEFLGPANAFDACRAPVHVTEPPKASVSGFVYDEGGNQDEVREMRTVRIDAADAMSVKVYACCTGRDDWRDDDAGEIALNPGVAVRIERRDQSQGVTDGFNDARPVTTRDSP
jgi:hypothetical protein